MGWVGGRSASESCRVVVRRGGTCGVMVRVGDGLEGGWRGVGEGGGGMVAFLEVG